MSDKKHSLSREKLQEQYEDLLFKKVMALHCEKESLEILDERQEDTEPDMELLDKILEKSKRKQTSTAVFLLLKKAVVCVSVFFFVCVLSFSSVLVVSAEAREYVKDALYHLIFEYDERYTAVGIGEATGFVDPHLYTWEGAYAPTHIPEGYVYNEEYSDFDLTDGTAFTVYFKDEQVLVFTQSNDSTLIKVDTENADRVEHIMIGESEALLVEKKGSTTIVWSCGSKMLMVDGNDVTAKIIKVAEGIKIFK